MQVWKRLGDVIGRNVAVISPVLVLLAVFFPDFFSVLVRLVPFMFAIITFQGSLGNDFHNLTEAFRHPLPLLITLALATLVLPLLAFLLGILMFGGNPNLVTGIVLEYSVPVAVVSIMWIDMYAGDSSLGLATLLVSTVLSPLSIPLTLHVLLGARVEVDALGMVWSMIVQVALPALAGTALNHVSGGWGKTTLSPAISPATRMMFCLVILANSTAAAPYLHALTPQYAAVIAFIGVFTSGGFALGLAAARALRQPRDRAVTIGFQSGLRNISAGAVIAAQYFPGEAMLPVIAGVLFQQVIAALFGSFIERGWEGAGTHSDAAA